MFNELPSAPALSVDPAFVFQGREVSHVVREMHALQAAQLVVERGDDPGPAQFLVEEYRAEFEPESLEESVIDVALRRILGAPDARFASDERRRTPREALIADSTAIAWATWASGSPKEANLLLKRLEGKTKRETGGAIHLLTLSFWRQATALLIEGDSFGARRFFKRAMDLGSQFGTESHPMISWAYAASFFHEGGRISHH